MAQSEYFSYVPLPPIPQYDSSRAGLQTVQSAAEINIGNGSNSFRADRQGIWMGSDRFATAPFRIDMNGNMWLKSAAAGGGYILIDAQNTRIVVNDGTNDRVVIGKL